MARFIFLCIGLFFISEVLAQSSQSDIPFEHISIPGTINSTQVNDMVIDQYGLIWIASDGLYRYDGYKFTSYKQISDTQTITGKEIICLMTDRQTNKLYLGTHSYGIVEYNYDTNSFRIIPSKGGIPIITKITQTTDGTIWAGSFSNGVFRIQNDTLKKVIDQGSKFRLPTSLLALGNSLLIDNSKEIYILKNGLLTDSILVQYPNTVFPVTTRLTAMMADREGKIWLGWNGVVY